MVSNVYNAQGDQTSETEYNFVEQGGLHPLRHHLRQRWQDHVRLHRTGDRRGTDTQYREEYFYDSTTGANSTNTYQGGQLTLIATVQRTGGHAFVYGYSYTYNWTTEALQSQINYANSSGTSYTYLTYGASNNLTSVSVGGSPSSTVSYVTNANGQIMDRTSSGGSTVAAEYFFLNGHQIGQVGNSGPDQQNYATTIANEATPPSGPPSAASADIGNTYTELGGQAPAPDAGSYTVQAGDTLQSIAQNMYGDLEPLVPDRRRQRPPGADAPLAAGQVLSLPNAVVNPGNNSSTFKPYNSSQATGQIQPNPPAVHHSGGCGSFGMILAAIVGAAIRFLLLGPGGALVAFAHEGLPELLLAGRHYRRCIRRRQPTGRTRHRSGEEFQLVRPRHGRHRRRRLGWPRRRVARPR